MSKNMQIPKQFQRSQAINDDHTRIALVKHFSRIVMDTVVWLTSEVYYFLGGTIASQYYVDAAHYYGRRKE